ncbi:MAG: RpiB/LacA/LacB family sugar-phosphate isomerase [Actinomycetota bacterium]
MIYLGADHGGYELKEKIKEHLAAKKVPTTDLGAFSPEPSDYPDFAIAVAEKVRDGDPDDFGVLVCTTSIGTSIAANKIKGVRAAVGYSENAVERARNDVDANVLCLGGGEIDHKQAVKLVDIFLSTPFSNAERHVRRLSKIQQREQEE